MVKANEPKEDRKPDPYTGEEKPPVPDADDVVEIVPVEPDENSGEAYLSKEETSMDALAADANAAAAGERSARFAESEAVADEFRDRQDLAAGRDSLKTALDEHHSVSPELSGGDIDADWQSASAGGEEAVGGTAPTPDQDVVDELGKAIGLEYEADEPLATEEKLLERDRNRWELDPESAEVQEDSR